MEEKKETGMAYVIMKSTGQYEDKYDRPVGVAYTEDEAKEHIATLNAETAHRNDIAIKDTISEYGDLDDMSYSQMMIEYTRDLIRDMFPRFRDMPDNVVDYAESEFTAEEEESLYAVDEQVQLAKWMKDVKGYPDDVIEATIDYNYALAFDEVTPHYHYYCVPIINL